MCQCGDFEAVLVEMPQQGVSFNHSFKWYYAFPKMCPCAACSSMPQRGVRFPSLKKKALCLGCTCLHFLAIPEATRPRSTRDQVRARGAAARRKAPEVDAGLMFNFVILHALLASKQIPNTSESVPMQDTRRVRCWSYSCG